MKKTSIGWKLVEQTTINNLKPKEQQSAVSMLDMDWTIRAKLSSQIKLKKIDNSKDKIKIDNNRLDTKTDWNK